MTIRMLKYEVALSGVTELAIPDYTQPYLTAMTPSGAAVNLWFEIDSDDTTAARFFQVFGTGDVLPPDSSWMGSVRDGFYIWHVYEVDEPSEPEDAAA